MKRTLSIAISVVLVISLGVSAEWLLLTGSSPQAVVAAISGPPANPPVTYARPAFQTGVVFPQWGLTAYSADDANWHIGMNEIHDQTAARWIEMTINLYQPSATSTDPVATDIAPTPLSLAAGIRAARDMGYHVFVTPLLTVGTSTWSGKIQFATLAETQAWFEHYWMTIEPYAAAAGAAGADQLAIGTEYFELEKAPADLWNTLIGEFHDVFSGTLTYDMNFTSTFLPLQPWMHNPLLTYIGISEYQPLTPTSQRLDPDIIPILWRSQIELHLDALSIQLGKPVLLSEIGYRNSADALYSPWHPTSTAPPDPAEQAAAYNAALVDVIDDPHIAGIYFWAWSVPVFEPNWLPAAHVLRQWYTSPRA